MNNVQLRMIRLVRHILVITMALTCAAGQAASMIGTTCTMNIIGTMGAMDTMGMACTESLRGAPSSIHYIISDTIPPPWDKITLTGAHNKHAIAIIATPFPWIWVAAGVAGAGVITYVIVQNSSGDDGDDDDPPADLIVRDDQVTVDCDGQATVDVLANDSGDGLEIISISQIEGADITFNGGIVTIVSSILTESTSTIINIRDQYSQSATSTLVVDVIVSNIEAIDDNYEVEFGGMLNENILSNDLGSSLSVTNFDQPEGGTVDVSSTGAMAFNSSDGFQGQTSFVYIIEGACAQVSQATVQITVLPPKCTFVVSITSTDSDCGDNNGVAQVTVEPAANYTYSWSNGATSTTIGDLLPGEYSVTVTSEDGACSVTEDVTIGELPADFEATFQSTPAKCGLNTGTITLNIFPQGNYTYTWSNGATDADLTELPAGNYTVTVTDENNCSDVFSTDVEEEPADYIVSITTIPGNCLGEEADIILTTQTYGEGPMLIKVTGPASIDIQAAQGETSLKDFFVVLPGAYHIVVSDMQIGSDCEEGGDANVSDNTIFEALDDNYETTSNKPLDGNVLDNDAGVQLEVTDYSQPMSGSVTLQPDGSFTYTPELDATGTFTFEYTVIDACGNSDTRVVTIVVNSSACNFTVSVEIESANCGLSDGAIHLELQPSGNYSYVWSNGNMTQDLLNIPSGEYTVTITSTELNCSKDTSITMDASAPAYLLDVQSTPGNCTGGGDITVELTTAGAGPLELHLTGQNVDEQFTLDSGVHQLGILVDLAPGDYNIAVFDTGAGENCTEQTSVTIDDDTPDLFATDDHYETPFETPVTDNVLTNDEGQDIEMTEISNEVGGTVMFDADGSFTFTPENGFSGEASFDYIILDACGNTQSATVFIEVAQSECIFTVSFITTDANCGAEDGNITALIDIPGTYTYLWSNGETSETIVVGAGIYTLTITEEDLGCSLEFEATLGESDAYPFFDNITVTDETCTAPGNITFDLSSATGAAVEISVSGPTMGDFFLDPGFVILGDLLAILPGDYVISATDTETACQNEFDATVGASELPAIAVESTIPPSSESANDGSITVVFTAETVDPYTYYLNGLPVEVILPPVFTITELSSGTYTIQVEDDLGCFSNELEVDLFPDGGFVFMVGISVSSGYADPTLNTVEHPPGAVIDPAVIHESLFAVHRFQHRGVAHESRADFSLLSESGSYGSRGLFRVQHTLGKRWNVGEWQIALDGGVALAIPVGDISLRSHSVSWTARLGAEKHVFSKFLLSLNVHVDGWATPYYPKLTLSLGRKVF